MRLLLDTNVVLDVLLARTPWLEASQQLWQATEAGQVRGYLPASALTDLFYIVRRAADLERARQAVELCLEAFEICPIHRATLEEALALPGTDFEDNVAIACAVQGGLQGIVTRDPQGFQGSPLPVWTPTQALERLADSE